jgi:methanogenic corrinoid protein MtbC1
MQPEEIREKILLLGDGEAVKERVINELLQEMVDLEMEKFEQVIAGYIKTNGIERTVIQIFFPFLERIGILWQTGHINPAQEHLVTNIIRNKLISAIDSAVPKKRMNKSFLLFLPEGEHHELGLLFVYYLLKSRGANVVYLGANVPLKDAEYVARLKKPDITFIHLTSTAANFHFEKFLNNIQQRFGNIQTIISGYLTQRYHKKIPASVQFKKSLSEVMEYLSSL